MEPSASGTLLAALSVDFGRASAAFAPRQIGRRIEFALGCGRARFAVAGPAARGGPGYRGVRFAQPTARRVSALMDIHQTHKIQEELIRFLDQHVGASGSGIGCSATTNLIEQGVLDSLLVTDLVLFMQTQFEIELSPRDIAPENLSSVQRMVALVRRKQMKQDQAA